MHITPRPPSRVRPLLAVSALLAAACGAAAPPTDAERVAQAREALVAEIGAAACSEPSQCRTVPVGHQACGGPEAWFAWSTVGGNQARIEALATRHAAARRAQVERLGMQSNCAIVSDPGAECRAGRCVLRSRARQD